MEIITMKQAKVAEEEMKELEKEGKIQEAAKIGMEIIQGFMHLPLIEKEAYQACFDIITKEQFYSHVIDKAVWCMTNYSSKGGN